MDYYFEENIMQQLLEDAVNKKNEYIRSLQLVTDHLDYMSNSLSGENLREFHNIMTVVNELIKK